MIDDNAIDIYLQEELMRRKQLGQSFSHFTSAEKVIEELNTLTKQKDRELPDLILLDIYMPKLDGFDFLNAYSKTAGSLRKHPILMVITSTIRKTDIQKMEGHPLVSGVLKKPLEVDHLKTILNA
jgi:CheY-like chemotaxis protein